MDYHLAERSPRASLRPKRRPRAPRCHRRGAFAVTTAVPAAAAPGPVACGTTLTVNTTLTKNLKCAGTGLTLAPGVTLDLGGFRLIGNGSGVAVASEASSGNSIVNGRIENWATGVRFVGETVTPDSELTLRGLRAVNAPLYVEAGDVALHDSTLNNSMVRIYYSRLDIARSTLLRSTTTGELVTTTVTDSG